MTLLSLTCQIQAIGKSSWLYLQKLPDSKHFSPPLLYKSGLSHCHLCLDYSNRLLKGLCLYSCSFTADSHHSKHSDPLRHNSDHTPPLLKTLRCLHISKQELLQWPPQPCMTWPVCWVSDFTPLLPCPSLLPYPDCLLAVLGAGQAGHSLRALERFSPNIYMVNSLISFMSFLKHHLGKLQPILISHHSFPTLCPVLFPFSLHLSSPNISYIYFLRWGCSFVLSLENVMYIKARFFHFLITSQVPITVPGDQ